MATYMTASSALLSSPTCHPQTQHANRKPRRRTRNYIVRATAKQLADNYHRGMHPDAGLASDPCFELDKVAPSCRRPLIEKKLRQQTCRSVMAHATGRRVEVDEEDGRDLAHSDVPLPSDKYRDVILPALYREDAFHFAHTAKGNVRVRSRNPQSDDAEVAELYRMGLLYDNDNDKTEGGFDLNSITHKEPVYQIRQVNNKRLRQRSRGPPGPAASRQQLDLDLGLSFTDLGTDDVLARYLVSTPTESPRVTVSTNDKPAGSLRSEQHVSSPLKVVYELANSLPALGAETSQPPDLVVDDSLSDYDYFSENDLADLTPTQRELLEEAISPSTDAWIMLGDP